MLGFIVGFLVVLFALLGSGLNAAGIYYANTDWGSEEKGVKSTAIWLLIGGLAIMLITFAGATYYLFRPSTTLKGVVKHK